MHALDYLFPFSSDRKRIQDREELWQRLEQQAADNYANLTAQGAVTAPLPSNSIDPTPAPLSKRRYKSSFYSYKVHTKPAMVLTNTLSFFSLIASFDQDDQVDMAVDETLDGGVGADQDLYSGDLQTFENNGPVFHQFRRKSIIPVDETVLTELSRHRSLEEVLNMQRSSANNENE